jgi:hypothetical protein
VFGLIVKILNSNYPAKEGVDNINYRIQNLEEELSALVSSAQSRWWVKA